MIMPKAKVMPAIMRKKKPRKKNPFLFNERFKNNLANIDSPSESIPNAKENRLA